MSNEYFLEMQEAKIYSWKYVKQLMKKVEDELNWDKNKKKINKYEKFLTKSITFNMEDKSIVVEPKENL